jgi:ABC-type transport system substrate-binding protein
VPLEFSVMLTQYRAKTEAAVISYNQPDYLGPSDNVAQQIENTWAPRLHYTSDKALDLAKKSDAELDQTKRIDLLHQVYKQLLDDGPYVMLVQGKTNVVTSPKVQGYEYLPIGTTRLFPVSKS